MAVYSEADLFTGLAKEQAMIIARADNQPIYQSFKKQMDDVLEPLKTACRDTRLAELRWHAEIGETKTIVPECRKLYLKWKNVVQDAVPGAELVDWEGSDATPDEIDHAMDNLIAVVEAHSDALEFAAQILDEVVPPANELTKEKAEDREAYRTYSRLVDEKDALKSKAQNLFMKIRSFIRADLGSDSAEYQQLRDRNVRQARKETMPDASA